MPLRITLEFHDDGSAIYEIVEVNKGKKHTPVSEMELTTAEARQVMDTVQTALGAIQTVRMTNPDYLEREFRKTVPTGGRLHDPAE